MDLSRGASGILRAGHATPRAAATGPPPAIPGGGRRDLRRGGRGSVLINIGAAPAEAPDRAPAWRRGSGPGAAAPEQAGGAPEWEVGSVSGHRVDLNGDLGESFGPYRLGDDRRLLGCISSANVACGYHGGDPRVMDATVREAVARGVRVGAHPGFPDLVGFGRRDMRLSRDEARSDTTYQIGALHAFCRRHGTQLQHVKPHGQMNNLAFHDRDLAEAIVTAVADFDSHLILLSYGGWLARAAEAAGLPVAHEAYADRAYNADGTLVSRDLPGAVIHEPARVVERALDMVRDRRVRAVDGAWVDLRVDSICVHGDTPGAAELAAALREALAHAGVVVAPLSAIVGGDGRPSRNSAGTPEDQAAP
jgi:UPF0271 protein